MFNYDIETGQMNFVNPQAEREEDLEAAMNTVQGLLGILLALIGLVVVSVFSINERFK